VVEWSEYLAADPELRVRFPALPDFLRSSGSGTGFTQPREYNWAATWKNKVAAPVSKTEITAVGIRLADHATPLYPQNLALTSHTIGGRSVGIIIIISFHAVPKSAIEYYLNETRALSPFTGSSSN
jgi:hypothetical protein